MADEQLRQVKHGKQDMKPIKESLKPEVVKTLKKTDDKKVKEVTTQKKEDVKTEQTYDGVKKPEVGEKKDTLDKSKIKPAPKKHEVSVNGKGLPISLKYSTSIGKFIRGKKIHEAILDLEEVLRKKRAIPMTGEMAHKKGKGMATGKYPVKASKNFIKLLRSLSTNSVNHGMELEKTKIYTVIPNKAPEQVHRFGRKIFKRTHIKIVAKEIK